MHIVFILAMLVFVASIIFIILRYNYFRIQYLNVKKWFRGSSKSHEIADYYNQWTDKYLESEYGDIIQARRPFRDEEMLDYFIESARIEDGLKLLDAGCGVCAPAVYFAKKKNVKISAITNSARQVEIASQKISEADLLGSVDIKLGDYHQMDKLYDHSSFDLIYFLESYGHATDQKAVLEAACRLLKPGGYIYIKDFFQKEYYESRRKNSIMNLGIKNLNKVYLFNLADLYHTLYVLRKAGLTLIKVQPPDFSYNQSKAKYDFERRHNIKLFEQNEKVQQVEALELLFQKPVEGR